MYRKILFNTLLILAVAGCDHSPRTDSLLNFDEFWQTFQANYAFFEKRGVDWQEQHDKYRPQAIMASDNAELFQILSDMVWPLKDGHVTLSSERSEFAADEGTIYIEQEFNDREIVDLFRVSEETLHRAGFNELEDAGDLLQYATGDSVGYLRVSELSGSTMVSLNQNMDQVMAEFAALKGLIVDIRSNPGGYDRAAFVIASRFTDSTRFAYTRSTQLAPGEFTAPEETHLTPYDESSFDKPIVLLTNDASASAADVLALIMKQLPHVTIVGDHTQGIFSDMMGYTLPNGWEYTLSNQRYLSPKNECYEGRGVPVDISVLNTRDDLESRVDPVITVALDVLASKLQPL